MGAATAYPLPTHCLPTAYPLPTHCLPTAYPLPTHCLPVAYPSSANRTVLEFGPGPSMTQRVVA